MAAHETPSTVPPLGPGECQVWWAHPSDASQAHHAVLSTVEHDRRTAFRQQVDQDRFTVAAALLRILAGAHLGIAPATVDIERRCPDCPRPHGKPHILSTMDSVSHV